MLTWRWSVALGIAALGAVLALRPLRGASERAAPAEGPLELVGSVQAAGIDLRHCRVRLRPIRFELPSSEYWAEIDADGGFRFRDLDDTDYRVEIVARHDVSLVLGLADFVRPGRAEIVIAVDLGRLHDEARSGEFTANTD